MQAGSGLAFDVPTASGIHIVRAFEKVQRQYSVTFGRNPSDTIGILSEAVSFEETDALTPPLP